MMKTSFKLLGLGLLLRAVTIGAQPVITTQPTNQIVLNGSNVVFSVVVSGTGPFSYQWQLNGTNLPANDIITTVAGNGTGGFSGDDGVATNAQISSPWGLAADASGNLLIACFGNNRVRKVDTNGIITTVAGTGNLGLSGNGIAATNSNFNQIMTVAVDGANNFYTADSNYGRVRKVDTNGIVTTVAGTGNNGFCCDGSPATNAWLSWIHGLAFDSTGNLYITTSDNRTRKVNTNGIISTLATVSSWAVAADSVGNVYIADDGSYVRKVDTNGIVTIVAGNGSYVFSGDGGSATNAALWSPDGVVVDAYGNLFIADFGNARVRKVNPGGIITTVAGNGFTGFSGDGGVATKTSLGSPRGIAVDVAGNLFIAVNDTHRIRKVNLAGSPTLSLTSVFTNKATLAYAPPTNTAYVTLNGSYPTNAGDFRVIVTSPSGSVTSSVASLTVVVPPSITTQPSNTAVTNGSPVNLTVAAAGSAPLSYQWFTSSGRSAVAVANISGGKVRGVNVINGGSGYISVPNVQLVGGGGFGATATAVISNGSVNGITITSQGNSYFQLPAIQLDNPIPTVNQILPDQTNATLMLPSVTDIDGTNYFVVVTNIYGSVTSRMAGVTGFLPPQNFSVSLGGSGLQLQGVGTPNYPYVLQAATNLTPPVIWLPVVTNTTDTNGNWSFTDTNTLANPATFFRLRSP